MNLYEYIHLHWNMFQTLASDRNKLTIKCTICIAIKVFQLLYYYCIMDSLYITSWITVFSIARLKRNTIFRHTMKYLYIILTIGLLKYLTRMPPMYTCMYVCVYIYHMQQKETPYWGIAETARALRAKKKPFAATWSADLQIQFECQLIDQPNFFFTQNFKSITRCCFCFYDSFFCSTVSWGLSLFITFFLLHLQNILHCFCNGCCLQSSAMCVCVCV